MKNTQDLKQYLFHVLSTRGSMAQTRFMLIPHDTEDSVRNRICRGARVQVSFCYKDGRRDLENVELNLGQV